MEEIKKAIANAKSKIREPYTAELNLFNIHTFNNPNWIDDDLKELSPIISSGRKAYFKSLELSFADDWDKTIFVEVAFDELLFTHLHCESALYKEWHSFDTCGDVSYPFYEAGDFINRHCDMLDSSVSNLINSKLKEKYFLITKEWFIENHISHEAEKFPAIISAFEFWCESRSYLSWLEVEEWIQSYTLPTGSKKVLVQESSCPSPLEKDNTPIDPDLYIPV